jgi:hypothetical protein
LTPKNLFNAFKGAIKGEDSKWKFASMRPATVTRDKTIDERKWRA